MKIAKNPQGNINMIDRQMLKTYNVPILIVYYGHMVLVLGRVPQEPGMVRIVMIRNHKTPSSLSFMYLHFTSPTHFDRRFKCGM